MAEVLGFEDKIEGLIGYCKALVELDPTNEQRRDVADPAFFYGAGGVTLSRELVGVVQRVCFDIECHARNEYDVRGLGAMDLREDTAERRAERADVLAVMTAPLNPEARRARAQKIAQVLGDITSGETIQVREYDPLDRRYDDPRGITLDLDRPAFAVFRNGHTSDRTLTVQYDNSGTFPPSYAGEQVVDIDVPALFRGGGLVIVEQTAA